MSSVSTASGSKILSSSMHLARAVADRAVDLADDDRAAVAVEDPARRKPIGAEIDEAAHGALGPDTARDRELVQSVLGREHVAVVGEMRRKRVERRLGVLRLHGEHDAPEDALHLVRRRRRDRPA